jgi:hypothetical protein
VTDVNQLNEIKSLLNFYFLRNLDSAIDKVESEKSFNAAIYDQWLVCKKS